ncbi:hypothetical protein BN77_3197 [Rhizobium mesoamericanum STM3625]|uniref:Uncharacterized protein n=1 Tax=Rhizobium mesoamericanum STM3625 TaxID=1211777 RepID=K0PWM2_9HYPH|nr:hypothetical protein BN77_3197 [Rhizobium mesoamericanum STM3625]
MKRLGGQFEKKPNWESFAITDGRLITGQNPASLYGGGAGIGQASIQFEGNASLYR